MFYPQTQHDAKTNSKSAFCRDTHFILSVCVRVYAKGPAH